MTQVKSQKHAAPWADSGRLQAFRNRVLHWTCQEINTGWQDVIVPQGAAELAIQTGDEELLSWAEHWLDQQIQVGLLTTSDFLRSALTEGGGHLQGILLNGYCGNWGIGFASAAMLPVRQKQSYQDTTLMIADHIMNTPWRTEDGTLLHGERHQKIWVDTLYYSSPIFSKAYLITGDRKYAEEAVRQCLLHAKYLRSDETGLWHHDAEVHSKQRTINYWGRGNGWIIAAIADVLRDCPSDTEGYDEVVMLYRSLSEALVRLQHITGLWNTMPECPHTYLDTSASTMILFGLVTGIQLGLLEDYVLPKVHRGYFELKTWINQHGQLMGSQYPSGRGDWDNFKLSNFGENSYTTGMMMRLTAVYHQMKDQEISQW